MTRGKIVVVTGAAQGIGKAVAERFHAGGYTPFLVDKTGPALRRLARTLDADYCVADLGYAQECVRTADEILSRGGASVLVNNCGISPGGSLLETEVETWDEVLHVNVRSMFLLAKHLAPQMIRERRGVIVNVASVLGFVGARGHVAYCTSKGAIINFTRAIALDLAPYGVRANCVCPGSVNTPLLERSYERSGDPGTARKGDEEAHPLGRVATAAEIADAVYFLASDQATFITGAALVVDGGFSAR